MLKNVYIASAVRTAVGKAGRGTLAQTRPDDMGAEVIKAAIKRAGITPEQVEDVVMGCAFPEQSQGMNVARVAALRAGLPETISAMTLNRFCSSGLEAIASAGAKIEAGLLDIAIAGGTESMSMVAMMGAQPSLNPWLVNNKPEIYINMGNAGDNIARDNGYTREQLDQFALESHQKAIAAIDAGKFKDEIIPLTVPNGNGDIVFDTDEGPRRDASLESMAALRLAFNASPKHGFHTAATSSQTSDGAAAVCLMSEKALNATGTKPMAKLLSFNVAADSPAYLGPAQLVAIPKACELAGIKIEDVALFEANEAFAAVAIYVTSKLKLDKAKVNVNGGAIALGHPLGCTGAKLTAQIIYELKRRGEKYGIVTMCIGGGMGGAGVFEICD